MEQEFISNWKQIIWEYERTSILPLAHEPPKEWTQEEITTYLRKNKARHRIWASWWTWALVIWLPLLTITGVGCFLLVSFSYEFIQQYAEILFWVYMMPFCLVLGFIGIGLAVAVFSEESNNTLSEDIVKFGMKIATILLYWLSWILFWIVFLPFFPLLKLRQLQLQYAQSWLHSLRIAGWRKSRVDNAPENTYVHALDEYIREQYQTSVLKNKASLEEHFFPDSYSLSVEPYFSLWGYIHPYRGVWVAYSIVFYILSLCAFGVKLLFF